MAIALYLLLACVAAAEVMPAEVRVLSAGGAAAVTTVTVRAQQATVVDDRTAGARPQASRQGPLSVGDTFTDEITVFLEGFTVARPASIDVSDALVSTVRMFPEAGGTTVVVFVRQPVSYTIGRPSSLGEIAIVLRPRTVPTPAKPTRVAGRRRAPAPPATGTSGEVSVDAESLSYDQQSDTLSARGDVTLTRGGVTLRADEVEYNRTTQLAEARGNVVMIDPDATVTGERAHLNLEDETGWVDAADADMNASSYALKAGRIQKEGGPVYKVDGGVFTTCRCGGIEKPSWSISAEKTDIKLGGLGVARGATFRVRDTPVLWLPVLPFPANTERQTGFLMPRVSYSNRRGFQYEQPFFWAIDKSSDATVALDLETAARIGVVGEYRYVLSPQARGNLTVAYYNQHIGGSSQDSGVLSPTGGRVNTPDNRFAIAGRHVQPFYFGSQFYLDVFAISDDLFLREINNFSNTVSGDLEIRSTRYTRSRTGVIKTWTGGMAQVDTSYYQDLIDPQELVPQRLPQVRAEHSVPLLDDLVVGRVAAEAVDFQREFGFDGLRGDLAPELFVPFRLNQFLSGSIRGRVRETAYHLTDDEQVAFLVPFPSKLLPARFLPARDVPRFALPDLDTNETRELADVHGRIGTEFSRVFDFPHFGLEKIRHSIEPEVQYLFVPQVDQNRFTRQECRVNPGAAPPTVPAQRECRAVLSRGYLFDEVDAINHRNFVSYGITTRLLGRGPVAADPDAEVEVVEQEDEFVGPPEAAAAVPPPQPTRELLRASILHGYDISRELVDDSHMSDVDLGLRLTPADFLGLSYNATWNFEDNDVVGQTVGVVLREPWWTPPPGNNFQGPTTIGVAYNFVQDNVNQIRGIPPGAGFVNVGTEDLSGSLYLRLGDYVGFTFISRYDLDGGPVVNEEGQTEFVGPGFLERSYLLRLISRCNCWAVDFGVSDRTNPDERIFRLQLTLLGLGSFGKANSGNYVGMAPLQNLGLRRPAALGGSAY